MKPDEEVGTLTHRLKQRSVLSARIQNERNEAELENVPQVKYRIDDHAKIAPVFKRLGVCLKGFFET